MGRQLGLVLTLAGMGVGLVALAPDRFSQPVASLAFFIGVGFLGAAVVALIVPPVRRAVRLASLPVPPDQVLRIVRRNGWTPTDDDRSLFVGLLVSLARHGEIVLIGSRAWGPAEPIPANHFETHHILVSPLFEQGREWGLATRRPGQLLDDESSYDALRLPVAQLGSAVARIVELQHRVLSDDGATAGAAASTDEPPSGGRERALE